MAQVGRGNKLDQHVRLMIVRLRGLQWSYRNIARQCGVSTATVWKVLAAECLIGLCRVEK